MQLDNLYAKKRNQHVNVDGEFRSFAPVRTYGFA
jgi:hypothetical protein